MKIKLVFSRTESDSVSVGWTANRIVEVDVPDDLNLCSSGWDQWHLTGMVDRRADK